MLVSTVASVAGNFGPVVKVVFVYLKGHLYHLSGRQLLRLVVLFKRVRDMAKTAFDAERRREDIHHLPKLISRHVIQHLDVLEPLAGSLNLRLRAALWHKEYTRKERKTAMAASLIVRCSCILLSEGRPLMQAILTCSSLPQILRHPVDPGFGVPFGSCLF